ncbi:MAG: hypothetical protein IJH00_05965 [Erysipelotrichaceae bacterium]|nr:hypothetical protein [Erysipelotrichaceae bacterium]
MAKKKREYDPKELNGMSIYHDEKRTVYAPFFTKKAYIITEKNVNDYIVYIQGYLIALLVFSLSYIITKNFLLSLALGLLFIASTIAVFYFSFIRKAAVIENYNKKEKDTFIVRQAKFLERKNIITIIICAPLLAFMIMLNSYINNFNGAMFYFSVFIAAVAVLYGLLHVYALIYKNKHQL